MAKNVTYLPYADALRRPEGAVPLPGAPVALIFDASYLAVCESGCEPAEFPVGTGGDQWDTAKADRDAWARNHVLLTGHWVERVGTGLAEDY